MMNAFFSMHLMKSSFMPSYILSSLCIRDRKEALGPLGKEKKKEMQTTYSLGEIDFVFPPMQIQQIIPFMYYNFEKNKQMK